MATGEQINAIRAAAANLKKLDRNKVLRPHLGQESLEKDFGEKFDQIFQQADFMSEHVEAVGTQPAVQSAKYLNAIYQSLLNLSNLDNATFLQTKVDAISQVRNYVEELKNWWPHYYLAANEKVKPGSPDSAFIKQQVEELARLRSTVDQMVKEAKKTADDTVKKAEEEIATAVQGARQTATGASVGAAQAQFGGAKKDLAFKAFVSGSISALAIFIFFVLAHRYIDADLPKEWRQIVYFTTLRVVMLTAVASIATYSLGLLKAYLHLLEHNLHRQRVANSVEAFLGATPPEHRGLVLNRLVDAVASFGQSGLVKDEKDSNSGGITSRMTIDTTSKGSSSAPT